MKKGEIILKILETVKETALTTTDILGAILEAGYGASHGKLEREFLKRKDRRIENLSEKESRRKERQKYYSLIHYLKKNNLIRSVKNNDKKEGFIISKKGKNKAEQLKEQINEALPKISYKKEKYNNFIIVIFDIPEKERRKRDWLRRILTNLEFQMIQKSVWMGKIKIPKELLDDLLELKLINFVEIFEISKAGSLERLI